MKKNQLSFVFIVGLGFYLIQCFPALTCQTDESKKEEHTRSTSREDYHPNIWLRIHEGKQLKLDTPPPARQKVDLFGKNTTFFEEDGRVYFRKDKPTDTTLGTQ